MALRSAFLLLLSVCAFGAGIAAPAFPMTPEAVKCGLNQEFQTCGSACVPDCSTRNQEEPKICTLQCVIGCFCTKGYLKNAQGECVLPHECDARTPMQLALADNVPTCPANEVFNECGSACAPDCANPTPSGRCTKNCVVGCFCKEGHLRNGNGLCVPANQCEAPQTLVQHASFPACPANEEFNACGSACTPNCAKPHPSPVCTRNCVIGCFCKEGLLRNGNGLCVPANQCEAPQTLVQHASFPTCPANEEFNACGSACTPNCAKPHPSPVCTRNCVIGCFCKEGLLRNGNGICVPANQCEAPQISMLAEVSQCKENEIFNECGSACAPTCANPNPSARCTKNCVIGCFCKPGYLKNEQGVCVPSANCGDHVAFHTIEAMMSPAQQQCDDNEEYRECKGCDGTCEKHDVICPSICLAGCACKQGYVRNNGICVLTRECPMLAPQCGFNEEFRRCKGCDGTCEKTEVICPSICLPGCGCMDGYVRNNGMCVLTRECPAHVAPVEAMMLPAQEQCDANEEFRECKGCDGTCKNRFVPCPLNCVSGCACKKDHVRENGRCIPAVQCPQVNPLEQASSFMMLPPVQKCGQHEVFHPCGTACPATCANPHPNGVCTRQCVIGCFCEEGFLKNAQGVCVAAANC